MSAYTGGPAFPLQTPIWHQEVNEQGYKNHDFTMGMTVRDYFAAQVIGHLVCADMRQDFSPEQDASYAYRVADAMLKVRRA